MIIIVEGIDRCGKTTFIDKMCEQCPTLLRFKDSNVCSKIYSDNDFSSFSLGKLDTSVSFLKQLTEKGFDVIVDRLHLTEMVYGSVERKSTALKEIGQLDNELAKLDSILVLVEPTNLQWSNEQAKKNQTEHYFTFKTYYMNSAIEKYHTNFNDLDEMVQIIMHRMSKTNKIQIDEVTNDLHERGHIVSNTKEFINYSSIFKNITTDEILKTFDLDKSLTMNFKYDVENKIINTYASYRMEKYHDIFDKLRNQMQHLDEDIATRRCVIQFDKEHCFQTIQFFIRRNELIVICNMRSCNVDDNLKTDIYICSLLADEFKKIYVNKFRTAIKQTHTIIMNIGSLHSFIKEETVNASEQNN